MLWLKRIKAVNHHFKGQITEGKLYPVINAILSRHGRDSLYDIVCDNGDIIKSLSTKNGYWEVIDSEESVG